MSMRTLILAAIAALPLTVPRADAQVVATFGSQTVTADANGDITINVGQITATALLKVHDPTAGSGVLPAASLRVLTVVGTANAGGTLQILVANPGVTDFPTGNGLNLPLEPGVANWAAPNANCIVFSSTSLRDAADIAAAVTGNIEGNIQIGKVTKLQALGVTDLGTGQVTGGAINSNITATAADPNNNLQFPGGLGNSAINVIEAFR
ncbi:MAG: hypothetical protein K2W85_06810 [Phycisphaerales bacterium]|nr:hypothetical protein [Phycisphaerales bacterium]